MPAAIETFALEKRFGETRALAGIDLAIEQGAIYGLLGPNGAGKTTTVRVLATLLKPDGGRASVLGFDVASQAARVREKVCLTGQYASVDEDLTGRENMVLIGRLFGLAWGAADRRGMELLEAFGLAAAAKRQVRTYSGGMRRRLDIAAGLVVTPEIVFLDEPTTGLDPRSRTQVWDIVRAIAAQGTTILLTTQYMEEADRLADRLAVIDHGRVIAEGTSAELKAQVGASTLRIRMNDTTERARAAKLLAREMKIEVHPGGDPLSLTASVAREKQVSAVYNALLKKKLRPAEFAIGQPTMDEVFFALTGHPAEVEDSEAEVADAANETQERVL